MGVLDDLDEPMAFDCPRCHRSVRATSYGPCETCAAELRVKFARAKTVAAEVLYEPKMNVTPNAVALKDD